LWAPIIGRFGSLWDYLQQVTSGLVVPFAGVFFFGVAWKRITTKGVWAGTLTGFVIAVGLMADRMWTHLYGHAPILPFMHTKYLEPWLHGAILEFLISAAVMVAVSLQTTPEPAEKLATTTITWGGKRAERLAAAGVGGGVAVVAAEPKIPFLRDYRPWLVLVLAMAVALYVIFSIGVI
jgi:SSS family solute:Na+ symporter